MLLLFSLAAGVIFGARLSISDMVNPARVVDFLDVAGSWDPTLGFVMAGALAVTTLGYRLVFRLNAPLLDNKFHVPAQTQIDLPLIGGAALFGVGWGLAGMCPGPALTVLVTLDPKVVAFVAAMLIGMMAARVWRDAGRAIKGRGQYLT